jgi:polyhydroxyalkanoate synthesis regulator phasin
MSPEVSVRDEIRRIALFGSGVAELTRHRAEQMVKDFVKQGEIRRDQASGAVKELMDRNRQNRQELLGVVRAEIRKQVEGLGLATKRDVERLERRVARLEARGTGEKSSRPAKKTTKKTTKKPPGGASSGS